MTEVSTQPSTASPTAREDTSVALIYQQIKRSPEAIAGLAIMVTVVLAAIAAPILAPYNPYTQNLSQTLLPPSWAHLMGTDNFGRDIFSRVIFGSRIDLTIAFSVVALAGPIGTLIGIFSGFRGGRVDEGLMRVTDVFLAFPDLILVFTIAAVLGRTSIFNVVIALVITFWTPYARLARAQTLHVKKELYIESARAMGSSRGRTMLRDVLPMVSPVVLVHAALQTSAAILSIAALGFLGIGAQPPASEWGLMISGGLDYLTSNYWVPLFPGLAIVVTAVGFNLIGDSVRDVLDVRSIERR